MFGSSRKREPERGTTNERQTYKVTYIDDSKVPMRFPTFKKTDSRKKAEVLGLIDRNTLAEYIRTMLTKKLKDSPRTHLDRDTFQQWLLEMMVDKISDENKYFDVLFKHNRTTKLFRECADLLAQQCEGILDCTQNEYYFLLTDAHKELEEIYKAKKEGKLFDTELVLAYVKDKTPTLPKTLSSQKLADKNYTTVTAKLE